MFLAFRVFRKKFENVIGKIAERTKTMRQLYIDHWD